MQKVVEKIKVSVIVTVFNSGNVLEKCLSSLLDQTLREIEIVVINDGSSDLKDEEIVQSFLAKDNRIVYVKNPRNLGTGWSREIGVEKARGEFVGFLDADDFAMPNAFEILYSYAVTNNCEISIGDYLNTKDHDIPIVSWDSTNVNFEVLNGVRLFDCQINRIKRPYYLRVDWWNKIYKRELFIKNFIKFPRVVRNEGTMSMIMSLLANKCVIVDLPIFYSFNRPDSVCRVFRDKNIQDTIDSTLHFKKYLIDLGYYEKFKTEYTNFFYYVVFNHNLNLLLKIKSHERKIHSKIFINKIFSDKNSRLDFYRYITMPNRKIERLIFASLQHKQTFSILKLINNTDFHDRREGGLRLSVDRRRTFGKKPLVSVVTITMDLIKGERVDFFNRMVKSLTDQTYGRENIEHIIIDGASKDGTIEYIKSLDRVDYWVSEPDSGIYNAMNKGPKYARGEYVLFLNSDDYLHESAIQELVDSLINSGGDCSFANAAKVDKYEKKVGSHIGNMNKIFFGVPYCHQTLLCKNICFNDVYFDENFKITMWSFSLQLYLKKYKHVYVDKTLAFFRVGGISTDSSHEEKFKAEQTKIKVEKIVSKLQINIDEYEYINHLIRGWSAKNNNIDLDLVLKRLSSGKSDFEKDFYSKALALIPGKYIQNVS